jgi:predicted signal transduction protein with EAL and GGDEF domain
MIALPTASRERMRRFLISLLSVQSRSPELLQAQVRAFSRQVPLMYVLVVANTLALAATHLKSAPPLLTYGFAGLLCLISVGRLVIWWRAKGDSIDPARARTLLRQTVTFAGVLGVGFTVWGFCLYPYGDAYAKAHVAFYMAITAIGCIFCLMHMRTAALLLTAIVVGPMALFFLLSGNPVFMAIAFNMVAVAVTMIIILLVSYRDFADLVESRRGLEARQAETQRLSDENLRLANLDGLTGLPNRRQFFHLLERTIERAGAEQRRFVVGVIDLDGFKPVNDAYGHAIGDRVLIEAGQRLSREYGRRCSWPAWAATSTAWSSTPTSATRPWPAWARPSATRCASPMSCPASRPRFPARWVSPSIRAPGRRPNCFTSAPTTPSITPSRISAARR